MSYRRTHYELEVRLFLTDSSFVSERVGQFHHLTEAAQEVIKLADALEHGESRDSGTFDELINKRPWDRLVKFEKTEILVVGVTVQWFDGQTVCTLAVVKSA